MKQWKECQSDIWREKRNTSFLFLSLGFSLNCSQLWGYSPPSPPPPPLPLSPLSHLLSTPPPATHFSLINDPSPTTRLCFYRLLLFKVDLLWPVSSHSPASLDLIILRWSLVTSSEISWLEFTVQRQLCIYELIQLVALTLLHHYGKILFFFVCLIIFECVLFCHLQPNQISMDENILVSRYINNTLLIDGELQHSFPNI